MEQLFTSYGTIQQSLLDPFTSRRVVGLLPYLAVLS